MKIVNVVRNYLSESECNELNTWMRENIEAGNIRFGVTNVPGTHYSENKRIASEPFRYTTRINPAGYTYPQLVRDIHARIELDFNLTKWAEPKHTHGQDGVVASATLPGGDVYLHKDGVDGQEPKHTLRSNILTSAPGGGLIWVNGESYTLQKGDMMQYLPSRYEHKVEPVVGNTGDMRIMWMFGWYVDADEWEASINASSS
jgi:hypothetical protein